MSDEEEIDPSEAPRGPDRQSIVAHAIEIAEDFRGQGLTLTLRQMYYQFVSRGLSDNGQKHYNRIGAALTEARFEGDFPIDWLEDRGREVHHGDFTRHRGSFENAIKGVPGYFAAMPRNMTDTDRWYDQPVHVSVWVEKQALEGIFSSTCDALGVGYFACKGYPSVSALYDWLKNAYFAVNGPHDSEHGMDIERPTHWENGHVESHGSVNVERAVILYFGDHDPDGWEIPRSAERSLERLGNTYDLRVPIEFRRIALNMDQIRRFNPPPFAAKETSSRFKKYLAEHDTTSAWELDALNPATLRELIESNVKSLFDPTIDRKNQRELDKLYSELRQRVKFTIE